MAQETNSRQTGTDGGNLVVSCLGGDRTALERRPVPRPGPGEMLLRLRVVGFCGTDLFKLDSGAAQAGAVLGHELVGEVIELGHGVTAFQGGDRVAVPHHVACGDCLYCRRGNETMCEVFRENLLEPGAFADTILVRARAVDQAARRIPAHLSDEAAVFMEPASCVLRGLRRAELDAEGAAVVLGAGSMGLLHLLVLSAAYPGVAVTVVDPVPDRRALAEKLGAHHAAAPGPEARNTVLASTNGAGADAVFDTVGGGAALEDGLNLTRQGGAVVLFSHAPGQEESAIDLNRVFKFERRILGTYSAALKEQAEIFELAGNGKLDPSILVTHKLPLDEFERGVSLVRKRQALKVLFTPSEEASRA